MRRGVASGVDRVCLFFIFSYIILGHLDDYIENIGIKYGIIKSNI